MNIITLNLPRTIKEAELADLFKPYGAVESCNLVLDKKSGISKGFGFVEIKDEAQASAAIAALHGSKVINNKIRVKEANPENK